MIVKQPKLPICAVASLMFTAVAPADPGSVLLPDPVTDVDYHNEGVANTARVELGRSLFFDKLLSGNQNISCGTCHHALTDTGDGLSLPVGEGGRGLGVTRDTGTGKDAIEERVPRNAPPVFNLGAKEFTRMFHDGRVEVDYTQPSGFHSPAGPRLPLGLNNVLAAQAMFPVTSATEMAGQGKENSIAKVAAAGDLAGPDGVWAKLAQRLRDVPAYVDMFQEAFGINADDITYVHAANAIAAFEAEQWRFDNSPFDRYLRGDNKALTQSQQDGMTLFYKKTGCAGCHSGKFQTDHQFHAIAMPQVGNGKGDGADGREDFGRERVTTLPDDRYRFRTPSLRNVALTGPWGHDGAYDSLEAVVRHHLDPVSAISAYDCHSEPVLPSRADLDALDCLVQDSQRVDDIAGANELAPVYLEEAEIAQLIDFLHALTDPAALDLRGDVPMQVASGLPVVE